MEHLFILEANKKSFKVEINKQLAEGYRQVAGSSYVKSIETDVPLTNVAANTKDIEEFYSVSLENEVGTSRVVIEDDPDGFYNVVIELLAIGYKIIIGSLHITSVRKDGYIILDRCQQTWYSCVMYKH